MAPAENPDTASVQITRPNKNRPSGICMADTYHARNLPQNPEAVQCWKDEEFPAIRAAAKAEGATIYFADEASIRSDYHSGPTWAPVGKTPVVRNTGARYSVNMISAISVQGALRFTVR